MRQGVFPNIVKKHIMELKSHGLGFYLKNHSYNEHWRKALTPKQIETLLKEDKKLFEPIFNWNFYIYTKEGLNDITNSLYKIRKLITYVEDEFKKLMEMPTDEFLKYFKKFKEDNNTKLYYLLFYGELSKSFFNSLKNLNDSEKSSELSVNANEHFLFIIDYLKEKKLIKP